MTLKRLSAAVLLASILTLAAPVMASAAVSVSASGSTLQISATNVNPFVTINHQTNDFLVSDAGATIVDGAAPKRW